MIRAQRESWREQFPPSPLPRKRRRPDEGPGPAGRLNVGPSLVWRAYPSIRRLGDSRSGSARMTSSATVAAPAACSRSRSSASMSLGHGHYPGRSRHCSSISTFRRVDSYQLPSSMTHAAARPASPPNHQWHNVSNVLPLVVGWGGGAGGWVRISEPWYHCEKRRRANLGPAPCLRTVSPVRSPELG